MVRRAGNRPLHRLQNALYYKSSEGGGNAADPIKKNAAQQLLNNTLTEMTDPNLVPPKDLVDKWVDMLSTHNDQQVFTEIAQWGSNIELEACVDFVQYEADWDTAEKLRADRRPNPPSLKVRLSKAIVEGDERQALKLLEELDD
jgi:hypothetical protein